MLETTLLADLLSLPFQVDTSAVVDTTQAVVDTVAAAATTAAESEETKSISRDLLALYKKGKIFMHILAFLSILSLGFSFVKFFMLVSARAGSKKVIIKVSRILQEKGVGEALEFCQRSRGPVETILSAGLERE